MTATIANYSVLSPLLIRLLLTQSFTCPLTSIHSFVLSPAYTQSSYAQQAWTPICSPLPSVSLVQRRHGAGMLHPRPSTTLRMLSYLANHPHALLGHPPLAALSQRRSPSHVSSARPRNQLCLFLSNLLDQHLPYRAHSHHDHVHQLPLTSPQPFLRSQQLPQSRASASIVGPKASGHPILAPILHKTPTSLPSAALVPLSSTNLWHAMIVSSPQNAAAKVSTQILTEHLKNASNDNSGPTTSLKSSPSASERLAS